MSVKNSAPQPQTRSTAPNIPAPGYSSIAGAIVGIILWLLSTYAFRGQAVPAPVEAAAWVLIPAAVTGIASHITRRTTK